MATNVVLSNSRSGAPSPPNQSYFQTSRRLGNSGSNRGVVQNNGAGKQIGGLVVRMGAKERRQAQAGKGAGERTLTKSIDPSR